MTPTELQKLAKRMRDIIDLARHNCANDPYVTRDLRPDVEITLRYDVAADRYVLFVRSQAAYPTPDDIAAVARAFGLDPDTILPDHYRTEERHAVTGRRFHWHTARIQWRDRPARRFSAATPFTAPCEA